jgi:hypothetical protein
MMNRNWLSFKSLQVARVRLRVSEILIWPTHPQS